VQGCSHLRASTRLRCRSVRENFTSGPGARASCPASSVSYLTVPAGRRPSCSDNARDLTGTVCVSKVGTRSLLHVSGKCHTSTVTVLSLTSVEVVPTASSGTASLPALDSLLSRSRVPTNAWSAAGPVGRPKSAAWASDQPGRHSTATEMQHRGAATHEQDRPGLGHAPHALSLQPPGEVIGRHMILESSIGPSASPWKSSNSGRCGSSSVFRYAREASVSAQAPPSQRACAKEHKKALLQSWTAVYTAVL